MLSPLCRAIRLHFVLLILLSLHGSLPAEAVGAGAEVIRVAISPALHGVRPLKDLVDIKVAVAATAQGPVQISLQLWAPPRGGFFTTDFPLVEGTQLLEMAALLPDGNLDWSYAFPIRGTYRLDLKAVDASGSVFERTVFLEVSESWTKWVFLLGFFVSLFVLGWVAGRVFSRHPVSNLGLFVVILGALTFARAGAANPEMDSSLVVSSPRVGSLGTVRWSVTDGSPTRFEGGRLTITIAQLEKERTVFRLARLHIEKNFEFGYQFTDASEHEVTATVEPETGGEPTRTTERAEVTSPEPSLADRLRPVFTSLFVVTAGLITGRLSRKRNRSNQ